MLEVKNLFVSSYRLTDNYSAEFFFEKKKKYLLHNISLKINRKEIHCILGKNGSGKSTLAYALMGLDRVKIEKGKIFLEEKEITQKKPFERAKLGLTMAFQEPARFEGLSVRDFLLVSIKEKPIFYREKEIKKILAIVGLKNDFLDRRLDERLSGGERKRIELASVILMEPKILILDEPDASLDIIVYNELYDLIFKIKERLNCAVILITHREEAGIIADRASLMEEGKIIKTGGFREVMRTYCQKEGKKKRCYFFKRKFFK